jgi:hypothetical protein
MEQSSLFPEDSPFYREAPYSNPVGSEWSAKGYVQSLEETAKHALERDEINATGRKIKECLQELIGYVSDSRTFDEPIHENASYALDELVKLLQAES